MPAEVVIVVVVVVVVVVMMMMMMMMVVEVVVVALVFVKAVFPEAVIFAQDGGAAVVGRKMGSEVTYLA